MSYNINAQTMLDLLRQKQEYKSSETVYLKLTQGMHQLRFCPPWSEEGSPCRMIVQHGEFKDKEGNKRFPLCYQYVFDNISTIAKALVKRNLIQQADADMYQKMGCIFCGVSNIIKQTQGKQANKAFAKTSFFWNVVNRKDNKVYIFRTSGSAYDTILQFFGLYPNMFNPDNGIDFMITATGENLQRRYIYNAINNPTPIGIDLKELHDLDTAMGEGYKNLNEAIELILNTYPQMMNILGINPANVMTGTAQF